MELIREENFLLGNKLYSIKVEFDGDSYIASGYLDGKLVNQTQQSTSDISAKLEADSSEIDNLVYLIKEDFKEHEL